MASFPVELLLGLYLGLLTGVVPALISGALGFTFKYFTGVTLPGLGVVVLAVAIAGVNGGLLGLIDPTIANSPRLLTAVIVVMMLSLYAHSQGDKLGAALPRRFSLRALRKRTLSADVVDFVGGIGQVTLRPAGDVRDLAGYPPLSPELRATIREGTWRFPADLPLSELETRLAERLKTDHDLADVSVSVDSQGRATIAAAPPASGLSRRVPSGQRAVSVSALLPSGMARGEAVTILTEGTEIEGTTLSATSDPEKPSPAPVVEAADDSVATDGGESAEEPAPPVAQTTAGGEGRITVAVPRDQALTLLAADRGRVVVTSRGSGREFELLSVLRRAGKRFRKVSVRQDGPLDGQTLGAASVRESYGVAVLAVRHTPEEAEREGGRAGWEFSPRGESALSVGDELFVVGPRDALDRFQEAVA